MSTMSDNSVVFSVTNQTTTKGAVLDLSDIDIISISSTYTPVGGGTGTLAVYESVDGQNFVAVTGLTVSITMAGTTIWHINPVISRYYKILYTPSSFGMTIKTTINARNNTAWNNSWIVPPASLVNS